MPPAIPPPRPPPRVAPPSVSSSKRKPSSRREIGGRGGWKTALVIDPDADHRKRVIRLLREASGESAGSPPPVATPELAGPPTIEPASNKPRLSIHEAENGSAAWALIEVVKPDLIVSEVLLEGLSGLQLLRRLRDKYGKQAPVVFFVTELSHEVDRYWALRNGAGAYVIKPYEDDFLRKRSSKLFEEGDEGGLDLDGWPIEQT